MMVAVIRRTQAIGIRSRLLAPTLTAAPATAHRPSVAPANTSSGSYLAARLAVVSWVMAPHSPRNTPPKLLPATRRNNAGRPPRPAAPAPPPPPRRNPRPPLHPHPP